MVVEEPKQVCSNGSSGAGSGGGDGLNDGCGGGGTSTNNRPSAKKQKQKKVPQRGLGVAQLERIRIEEQQRRETANGFLSHSQSAVSLTDSSSIHVSHLNYPPSPPPPPLPPPVHSQSQSQSQSQAPSPSIQYGPLLPQTNIFPPNSIYGQAPPLPPPPPPPPPFQDISNHYHLNSIPRPFSPANGGGFDANWPPFPVHENDAKIPTMLWSPSEFSHEGRNSSQWNYQGFSPFVPSISLPLDTSHHIASLPDSLMPRTNQQYQDAPSLVNAPSSMSSYMNSSSAVQTYQQMEPPSNQNYYSSTQALLWSEEEKRAVMKRPYPFSVENPHPPPPAASFQSRLPLIRPPMSQSEESTSCGNGWTFTKQQLPIFRESPSFPTGVLDPVSKKSNSSKDNGIPNADFLTLGPPSRITPHPSPNSKEPVAAANDQDICNFESIPYQGNGGNQAGGQSGASSSSQQPPFFSFIPAEKVQVASVADDNQKKNIRGEDEGEDSLDLKLKL